MSATYSILFALAVCVFAAALEGLFAGKNIKPFLAKLRTPAYSPSLFVWSLIGVGYYAICFTILYRLFRDQTGSFVRDVALILLWIVMALNAFWNYTFFRLENLRLSFILSLVYGAIALVLFACLIWFDYITALVLLPYVLYMIYAYRWGHGLLKLYPDLK
jgi:benzodiazapine receptor